MKALFDETKYTKWYVTDDGEIFSITTYNKNDKELKKVYKQPNKRGYLYARTSNGNYQIHRLVASAFLQNEHNKETVNHKDGNKHNNKVENLEWMTYKENARHALKTGLTRQLKKNEGRIKYTNEQCQEIIKRVKCGMKYLEAGDIYKMPYSTVAHLMRGSRRKI